MNILAIFNVVGVLLLLLSGLLVLPIGISFYYDYQSLPGFMTETQAFTLTLVVSFLIGLTLWKILPSGVEKLRDREGFAIVALSWIAVALAGAFPYYLSGACPDFIDAFFESMSGFTTTGATILTDIDSLPRGVLFWRSLTQWLGGMGIILLSMAIFPALGIGSAHLFKAEVPGGVTVERMQPRLAETAKILWKTYVVLTVFELILLTLGGVAFFDALCHSLSTVATGGFSTHNASIGYFNSGYVESISILFMFLGGISFALHYQLINGNFATVFKNPELRFYSTMIVIGIALATWGLASSRPDLTLDESFRKAAFNIVSINTTSGFVTDDFNAWPNFLRIFMLVIMMVGGCSGSTSGSLKAIRFIILFKIIRRELKKLVHPRAIFHVKVAGKSVKPDDLTNVVALTCFFMGFATLGCILLSLMGVDLPTAISASIACLFNIGPGLGQVGAMGTYADIPFMGKGILITFMLMGRLEIFGIMLLFLPMAWRK
ncbi:MAG TPA: TrkH family potassium uptake protein [Nitrospinaceae bacterium]|jgi:trk system potassium uptake protein TrkH|nr:potassium transporter membrane component TrkH [Nitrospinota bacterium]MDP6336314.1 TrkH family potassium uptake protein [Nitrospinaceae bacterium]HAX45299.1 potassium transporter membrane component TrkH [Nitrospina sp.]MBV52281.1 potassium transporter membrane component TrkH [Nitrospinota bacterium]MDP7148122.1 TrkH family potassium uptake protein [Nitrospinaceae bacterium]|tara:strand:- start:6569 stop:8041 length:1473 start_codon:yes stop_codon:yes gene_type:complete